MKLKRQKSYRKYVRFYKVNFGFREPFKVLCDGNFIHRFVSERGDNVLEGLQKLLGGSVRPMTTRCVSKELKKLGPSFLRAHGIARQMKIAECNHETAISGGHCVLSLLESNNSEHFWIASQDIEIRNSVRKIPGGAVIFMQGTALILEPPSSEQLEISKEQEALKGSLTERESKLLGKPEILIAEPFEPLLSNSPENNDQVKKKTKSYREADKPVFQRKRAKGPNPLSMKKKKQRVMPEGSQKGEEKKRKRVRNKKITTEES